MDSATLKPVTVTQQTTFLSRLADRMKAEKLNQKRMAQFLGVGLTELNAWARGKKYPNRRYWAVLIAKGLASEAELRQWKPRVARPRRDAFGGRIVTIRTARGRETATVYTLKQYAALATD